MIRRPELAARRVRQTFTTFTNGPRVLWEVATTHTRGSTGTLTFRTRGGARISCPNVAGARVPVYELFAEDAYRFEELTHGLPEDFVAIDIGGQVGCFTVALALAHPRSRVHSYEASPVSAAWLRHNVRANRLSARVTVHGVAVTDRSGTLAFADNGQGSGLNGLTAPAGAMVIQVPCTTFTEAVAAAGGRVDLVKIDTEGAEYPIVLGTDPAAWAGVRRVVLEYHPVPGRSWAELEEFFVGAGFAVQRREAADEGLGTAWLARAD